MPVFDFSNKEKVFEFDDGGSLTMRLMTQAENERIAKITTKEKEIFKKVEGTPARFDKVKVDEKKRNEMFWDFVIIDWKNFKDIAGNDLSCTTENKVKLMKTEQGAELFLDCYKQLQEAEAEEAEAEEKN